jgi:hypothetical protein
MGSRKHGASKRKNHAQDCETLGAKIHGPSVQRSCHGFYVSNGVHPSDGTGILPVTPSRRIAAGHAARTFESPRAGGRMIGIGKPENHFSGPCENAREMRA